MDFIELYPAVMKVLIGVIIGLILLNFGNFRRLFAKVRTREWLVLLMIVLAGFCLRVFVVPHTHHMYFDEFEHINIAENILYSGRFCECYYGNNTMCNECTMMGWPSGYPVFLSLVFALFGDSEAAAFNANAVVGCLSIVLVFLLIYLMLKSATASLVGSFLLAALPAHLKFSGGSSPEILSVFFVLLCLIFMEIYLRLRDNGSFMLFVFTLGYAVNTRTENFLLIALCAVYVLIRMKKEAARIFDVKNCLSLFIFCLMIIPAAVVLKYGAEVAFEEVWGVSLSTRLGDLERAFIPNLASFVNPYLVPLFILLLVGLGCFWLWRNDRPMLGYLWLFFAAFFIMYSQSSNGFFGFWTSSIRYTLILYIPLIIMAACGFALAREWLKVNKWVLAAAVCALFIASAVPCIGYLGLEIGLYDEYEFIVSMRDRLPEGTLIIANSPASIISPLHRDSITTYEFIGSNLSGKIGSVILFKDYIWYDSMPAADREEIESNLVENYDFELIAESGEYSFYNLTLRVAK